jgi:hypothetical protein
MSEIPAANRSANLSLRLIIRGHQTDYSTD